MLVVSTAFDRLFSNFISVLLFKKEFAKEISIDVSDGEVLEQACTTL